MDNSKKQREKRKDLTVNLSCICICKNIFLNIKCIFDTTLATMEDKITFLKGWFISQLNVVQLDAELTCNSKLFLEKSEKSLLFYSSLLWTSQRCCFRLRIGTSTSSWHMFDHSNLYFTSFFNKTSEPSSLSSWRILSCWGSFSASTISWYIAIDIKQDTSCLPPGGQTTYEQHLLFKTCVLVSISFPIYHRQYNLLF